MKAPAVVAALGASLWTCHTATAQPAGKTVQLEDIVVTARKREELLQDVPQSVSAFTADDLAARSASSLSEIASLTPTLTFQSVSEQTSVRIRGIGTNDASLWFDPAVAIYLDGIYLARMRGVDLDLVDIARVEVLRGPQGTLFGRNATGGALNIVTVRPADELSGSVELTAGRFGRLDGRVGVNVPLVPDVLAATFSGAVRNRSAYAHRLDFATKAVTGGYGNQDSYGGRAVFHWTPREDLDVLVSVDASRSDEPNMARTLTAAAVPGSVAAMNSVVDPDYGPQMITGNPYTSYAAGPNWSDTESRGVAVNATWKRENWSLRSITGYRELDFAYGVDWDGSPHNVFSSDIAEHSTTVSQELQLAGVALAGRLSWITGLYYFTEDSRMLVLNDFVTPLYTYLGQDRSNWFNVSPSDTTSWAVFGQGTYDLTDKLRITAGLRYSEDEKTLGREVRRIHTPGVILAPFEVLTGSWDAVTSRLGIDYHWTDDIMAYVSAARGYKSGGINGSSSPGTHPDSAFDPEFIWTYEVGLRSEWLDHRLRVNLSAFYNDYTDLQFRVSRASPSGQPLGFVDNAGKAEVKGFEIELSAMPAANLTLQASAGYIDAKYTELDPTSPVKLWFRFPLTPEWSATVAGQYTLPLRNEASLTARLDYSYKTDVDLDALNTPYLVQDGYGHLNGRLTYDSGDGKWQIAVFGTNLTDEIVAVGGRDILTGFGLVDTQYAPPRQWGVSLRYGF